MGPSLTALRLRDFRCFADFSFEAGAGTNFFLGPNAAGKTSLLEGICVLLRLQSPRTTTLARCTRFAQSGFGIEGDFRADHTAASMLKLGIRQDAGGRKLRIDDILQAKSAEYLRVCRVTWFGNEDLELIRGGGSGRRRYFDFLGAQLVPGYLSALRSYERALRARNFLLREGRSRREVDAQSDPLADSGEHLASARRSLFPRLLPFFQEAAEIISGGGESAEILESAGHEGDLRSALDASRMQEERLRQTVVGPHRDDWEVLLSGRPASDFASEGQQRTLALSFKLAQSRLLEQETGVPPVLLLDDIFGELDPARRERLLASLPQRSQKFITTTFLDWCTPPADARQISLVGRGK
jgi:DNA replication and repair protein RecF